MELQETRKAVEDILREGIGLTTLSYVIAALACALGAWLGSFLAAKGKSRAIFQDVGRITQVVESIKNIFNAERMRWQHLSSVSLVAAERRLDAIQGAFRLTYRLSEVGTHDEGKSAGLLQEMREWYLDNAVYLPDEVRKLFFQSYYAPHGHFAATEAARCAGTKEGRDIEIAKATDHARVLRDVPKQILGCLQIPPFDFDVTERPEVG